MPPGEPYQSGITHQILDRINETNGAVHTIEQKLDRLYQKLSSGIPPHGTTANEPWGSGLPNDPLQAAELSRLRDENKHLRIEVSKLKSMVIRSRRQDDNVTDDIIERQAQDLKSGILQFVHNHASQHPLSGFVLPRNSSPDLFELHTQSVLASAIHSRLFSEDTPLFGISPLDVEGGFESQLRDFEWKLKQSGCDEDELRNWRVATLRLSEKIASLNDISEALSLIATQIVDDLDVEHHRLVQLKSRESAITELTQVCGIAYELAIMFRTSKIEYNWEQGIAAHLHSKAIEVVGFQGPKNAAERDKSSRVSFIVFGGVVRGDKSSGLLRDGTIRLSPSSVVKFGDF